MIKKVTISVYFWILVLQPSFGQLECYSSFAQLDSLSIIYFQKNKLDSAINVIEYALKRFPEHDGKATFILGFLYTRAQKDSLAIENWKYGHKKGYFYGLNNNHYLNYFKDNSEFNILAEIDKQIGDSINEISHLEYEVILPKDYSGNKSYPLLFVFHGAGMDIQRAKTNWTSKVMADNYVTVFIQSYIRINQIGYEWIKNDLKTNLEFKEIYEEIIQDYSVNIDKIFLSGMSVGGMLAADYAFNQFVPVSGLVLNCPVIPTISENAITEFVEADKKIGIITGENDPALSAQKDLIDKINEAGGKNKFTINKGSGHEFSSDFSRELDEYLNWIYE